MAQLEAVSPCPVLVPWEQSPTSPWLHSPVRSCGEPQAPPFFSHSHATKRALLSTIISGAEEGAFSLTAALGCAQP